MAPTIYTNTWKRDTHTHKMRKGGRFWNRDQCKALKDIIRIPIVGEIKLSTQIIGMREKKMLRIIFLQI